MGCGGDSMTGGGCMGDNTGGGGYTDQNSTWNKVMGSTLAHYPAPVFDPLGNDANGNMTGIMGGPEQRAAIFSRLNQTRPLIYTASDQAATRALADASNPGFTAAANLANKTINGDYLNGSPQLDAMLSRIRTAGNRETANTAANLKDQYARAGIGFGTGNQQAAQSNAAANTARMNDTEAQTRFGNYAMERANQAAGANQLNTALSSPLNYLSQVSAAEMSPLQQQAQLVSGLTNAQQRNVDTIERDGMLRGLFKTVGAL